MNNNNSVLRPLKLDFCQILCNPLPGENMERILIQGEIFQESFKIHDN